MRHAQKYKLDRNSVCELAMLHNTW